MFTKAAKWVAAPVAVVTSLYMYSRWRSSSTAQTLTKNSFSIPEAGQLPAQSFQPKSRPSDGLHIYFSVQAYEESNKQTLPENWKIACYSDTENNGYFGTAYVNEQSKHLIIAHRGTEGLDRKDWLSNLDLITRHLNGQEVSAWDNFAKRIVEKYGPSYHYSFTGHSLGGWLAQINLWKYQDEFVKSKEFRDAFAVTLDDPGARELLEVLQPRVDNSYKIDSDRLDITAYLSHPNIVNTALCHVGTTYALSPNLNLSWVEFHTPFHTYKTHDAQMLLKEFNENGLPKACARVIDWPKVLWGTPLSSTNNTQSVIGYLGYVVKTYLKGEIQRGEYEGFYTYKSNEITNPSALSPELRFRLQHGVHYRTEAFDEQKIPLRNMPVPARRFLEDLSDYSDRIETLKPLIRHELSPKLLQSLKIYQVNDREELFLDKNKTLHTARDFRDEIVQFLEANPNLYYRKLAVLNQESILRCLENGMVDGVLSAFKAQSDYTRKLMERLSFAQGTARLYQFIKPTEELKDMETESNALKAQLDSFQSLKWNVRLKKIDEPIKAEIISKVDNQEQQLKMAESSMNALLCYMRGSSLAEKELDNLEVLINNASFLSLLDKASFINRIYNLKAKIAIRGGNEAAATQNYDKALNNLPEDPISLSNYGAFLTDMARKKNNINLHIEAYKYYQKVDACLKQINAKQLPIVKSGMAYGFILLAQNLIQQPDFKKAGLPNPIVLQNRAEILLKETIDLDPNYLNARLFQSILLYEQGKYPQSFQEIENVLCLQKYHPTALMRKGFILDKLNNPEEAVATLTEAKKILIDQGKKSNQGWIDEIDNKLSLIQKEKKGLRLGL